MPIIRSWRLYRWAQRVAPHLGYGTLLVWRMAVGLSVWVEGCCTTYSHEPDQQPAITKVKCHTLGPTVYSQAPDDGHNNARNMLSES
jgi:hypothetical protein